MPTPSVLVFGAENPLARRIEATLLRANHSNTATLFEKATVLLVPNEYADVRRMSDVVRVVESYQPDVVVNAAGLENTNRCEQVPEDGISWNALGAANVAIACRMRDIGLVHISTGHVFGGGVRADYETPYPSNAYGVSKMLGERAVFDFLPLWAWVVRVGWLYGVEYEECQPMIAMQQGDLRANVTTPGAYIPSKSYGTPTFVGHAAEVISEIVFSAKASRCHRCRDMRSGDRGQRLSPRSKIVHVGPQEDSISWFEFLVRDFNVRPFAGGTYLHYLHSGGGLIPTPGFITHGYREGLDAFIQEYREAKYQEARTGT